MFEGDLYPAEIAEVMHAVLNGNWDGPNPELYIDALLHDFYNRIDNKQQWMHRIAKAVKQLGCLDCVFARLNFECLVLSTQPDTIKIRYDRRRLLPGENHGICNCSVCQASLVHGRIAADGVISDSIPQQSMVAHNDSPYSDTDEDNIYAGEKVIKREPPRPTLSPERKIEILNMLRASGYDCLTDREKAWNKLEKMLRNRSIEQNIIGRIAYLIIFDAFMAMDSGKFVETIKPLGHLPS